MGLILLLGPHARVIAGLENCIQTLHGKTSWEVGLLVDRKRW